MVQVAGVAVAMSLLAELHLVALNEPVAAVALIVVDEDRLSTEMGNLGDSPLEFLCLQIKPYS